MLLSEVLRRFFVLPFGQSELAYWSTKYDPKHGQVFVITWTDSETRLYRRLKFVDQDVGRDGVRGLFKATTTDGDLVKFIALDGVDLTKRA